MPRTIGYLGSVALLVSSITGPSMVVIPLLFQQAGWLTPLLAFVAIALLSGTAALFVVEAMSSIEGNEAFQASIEFTTIAHLFLGKRWHLTVQALLYLALQTLVIASLLESFQVCLLSRNPTIPRADLLAGHGCIPYQSRSQDVCRQFYRWVGLCQSTSAQRQQCILWAHSWFVWNTDHHIPHLSPQSRHLVDNIIFQVVSFIVLLIITVVWIIVFIVGGLDTNHTPVVGHNQSTVVGFVLSNFSFVMTIPAWVNNTHPSVNIRLVVWMSVLISCLIYIPIGWLGSLAFVFRDNATLLQAFATDTRHGTLSKIAAGVELRVSASGAHHLNSGIHDRDSIQPFTRKYMLLQNGRLLVCHIPLANCYTLSNQLSKRHSASAVLDANVSPGVPRVPEVEPPLTPIGLTTTPEPAVTPVENIPVVIITDSTDEDPLSTDEMKTLVSTSGEAGGSTLEAIPMAIVNRVSSPSRHRYYGQEVLGEGSDCSSSACVIDHPVLLLDTTGKAGGEAHKQRRPSLSLSLSRSSITHSSNTGMDEFLLISPTSPEPQSHSVRAALSAHSPRPSMSTGLGSFDAIIPGAPSTSDEGQHSGPRAADVRLTISTSSVGIEEQVPTFKAFPSLSPTSPIRSTRISAVMCLLAGGLVLTAIVYDIVQSVGGSGA
ncbi:hypothetical protein JVT61DRAFT_8123 [Boletus reticuloceps]|uniref:Amino acid transporter transmembrane domain-containing protein n=1 Tax=Boletus reticuloceps TaxID=495285 RepID=A0A8I3AE45_9AGAM|nr:hypothetical protein JVT61DRAFT_8123 [Boletus reticuloceps]